MTKQPKIASWLLGEFLECLWGYLLIQWINLVIWYSNEEPWYFYSIVNILGCLGVFFLFVFYQIFIAYFIAKSALKQDTKS
jgi:apolipoprotein N-acyltransferase